MSLTAIRIESVEVRYGPKTILRIPRLSIAEGEILAVIGPNGAGKSTLLQILGLLQRPSKGRVFFDGQEITGSSDLVALRRRLALVFQEPLLFHGTVFDNVALGLRLRGTRRNEIKQRVELWLAKLNISHLEGRSIAKLSFGEAQRVNLARSLVLNPEVLLLDEPFASLDPPTQASMVEELQNLLAETKTTSVFVTQNRAEALMLGHRLAVIIDGQIAQLDTPQNVFSHPANEDVAGFLGVETIVEGRVLSSGDGLSRVAMGQHEILLTGTYPPEQEMLFCLRPEDITLLLPDSRADLRLDANVIPGTIKKVTPLETQLKVVADCSFPVTVLASKQAFIDLSLAKGKHVLLTFKPSAVHVIPKRLPVTEKP
ncbi:MAG: ABC transporter ATP-binding protein [Deltaproteobacteria bacterium]|nr:ABC transporter ATP-binding protein [Deltaproteobacteria bacterium]